MREQERKWEEQIELSMSGYILDTLRRRHYESACRALGKRPHNGMKLDRLQEFDRIVLEKNIDDTVNELADRLRQEGKAAPMNPRPFLEEGVIIFPDGGITSHVAWHQYDKSLYLESYAVGKAYTNGKALLSYRIELKDDGPAYTMMYESAEDIIIEAARQGKIKVTDEERKAIEEATKQTRVACQGLATNVHILFRLINLMLEAEDEAEGRGAKKPYSHVLRANKKKGIGTRVVYLDTITVEPGKDSKIKIHRGGIMNRYTDVWGVRGHERHYKSGKVIWIEPYEKGPERGKKKREPKEYRLKG